MVREEKKEQGTKKEKEREKEQKWRKQLEEEKMAKERAKKSEEIEKKNKKKQEHTFVDFKLKENNNLKMPNLRQRQRRLKLKHTAKSARAAVLLLQRKKQQNKQRQIVNTKKLKEKLELKEWPKKKWKICVIYYMMKRIGVNRKMLLLHAKSVVRI